MSRAELSSLRPQCVLISTGGTIASRVDPSTGLAVPVNTGEGLIAGIPQITEHANVEVEEVFCVASPHIGPEHWVELHAAVSHHLSRADIAGVVISHGTALMEETACFLDLTIAGNKPVVLVGSQRNASQPDSDGPRNLLDAIRTAVSPVSENLGVLVVMNQKIHAARYVRKVHSFDVNAFDSGDWGLVGHIAPEGVAIRSRPVERVTLPLLGGKLPEVGVVPMYAGADGFLIDAAGGFYSGLIVQAVGAGHVNQKVFDAISRAIERKCVVVVTTRIPNGGARACYGFAGSSHRLQEAGAIIGGSFSAWRARILLMLLLQQKLSDEQMIDMFRH